MARGFRLDLLESRSRPIGAALLREGLGAAFMLMLVGGTVAVQAWRPERRAIADGTLQDARFLAPLRRMKAAPPREERVEFVGLGVDRGVLAFAPPTAGDVRRATTVASTRAAGARTLVQEASADSQPRTYTEVEVDSVAVPDPNGEAPIYPPTLLALGVEGVVLAAFVVDSTGRADLATFRLLQPADPGFVASVREALTRMRYRPALFGGRRVNQLAEQRFTFRLTPPLPIS